MIQARILVRPDGLISGFCIVGHSGRAESGRDVLCAFVSSAAYMAANTITDVIRANAKATDSDGYMRLDVAESDLPRCQDILAGLVLHLEETEKQYPKNLKVTLTEV